MKQKILNKVDLSQGFGVVLNKLQDIACEHLPQRSVEMYLQASNEDMNECEGMDCLIINGRYFDWKMFDIKAREIVSAWLDYFSERDLKVIYENM